MQRLSLLLSFVAVGLAGWFAWTDSCVRCELKELRAEVDASAALDARLTAVEKAAARVANVVEAPRPAAAPKPAAGTATLSGASAGGSSKPAAARSIEDLEKRIAALEKGGSPTEALAAARRSLDRVGRRFGPASFYGSVDDAEKDLDLSPGQKADFERVVADARRDLDDLHKIRDDDGKTWDDVQKETFKMEGGAFRFDMAKMQAFKDKTVPGRSETFGGAEKRIRDDAKSRMRGALSSEQQSKFDKATVEPLIGGGSGVGAFTFVTSGPVTVGSADGK